VPDCRPAATPHLLLQLRQALCACQVIRLRILQLRSCLPCRCIQLRQFSAALGVGRLYVSTGGRHSRLTLVQQGGALLEGA
jgi:hypothetical protein